ncbi:metal ABC transporter substrate-binding protein [[Ruminococcus] torques]|uniref:metal ABC transporter substrate-binding protein n=1 Tax=[Ruminococcus] torques TaxID=33039 RepID=UPI003999DA60
MKDVKKKIWRRRGPAVLVLCLAVIVQGCAGYPADKDGGHREQNKTNENGRLSVVTTIFPPYDFVREIAGDCVDLKMLLKPGEESHSYEPTPQDMIAIENSDVFIYVGGENDVWVEDILSSMPDKDRVSIRLLDCVETEEEEHVEGMKEPAGDSHHEMHGEEEHEGSVHEIDEHVWTSPVNASVIVEKIKEVLIQKDSENKAAYEENADRYQTELAQLDKRFREVVRQSKRNLLIFGDRFPFLYFAKEYGLEYYAAFPGCAGDTEPSAATMVFLIEKAKDENVPAVLKMELSNADIANAVAEASGTEVRIFYSCHNLSAEDFEKGETYLTMMQKNADTLKEVLNWWR